MIASPRPTMPPRPDTGHEPAAGYMVSSFELRRGLEVSALAFSALPGDVLSELRRLHLCWRPAPADQALR